MVRKWAELYSARQNRAGKHWWKMRETLTSAVSHLDLVCDEEHLVLVAQTADPPQVPLVGDHHARLALDLWVYKSQDLWEKRRARREV
jgi:hypothetical protein